MAKNQSMARVAAKCLLLAVSISSLAACRAGFDPDKVNLDGIVVNYGKNLENLSKPTAAVIFGKLSPKAGSEFVGDSFENQVKNVVKSVEQISLLQTEPGAANQQALKLWLDNLANEWVAINKALINASKNAKSALDLAKALEPLISDGGSLATRKPLVAASIVDLTAFNEQHKILTESMERLYQLAVLTANTLSQQKVSEESAGIRFGLEKLSAMMQKRGDLFSSTTLRNEARSAIDDAMSDLDAFDRIAGGMTKYGLVEPQLLARYNALQPLLVKVDTDFVSKVIPAAQSDAQAIQAGIGQANTALGTAVAGYNAIEKSKNATGNLATLVSDAFLGKVSTVTGAKLSEETDINDLAQALANSNVVFVKADDASRALVDALSSSVASNVAQGYGLTDAINVVGLDTVRLMNDRTNFGMDDGQFNAYLKNIGKKIRENGIKEGGQKNVYVVFANDFPKTANVKAMVDELSKDNGKVLVIGDDRAKFSSAAAFKPRGLSASEGLLVAHELLKKEGLKANQLLVSDRIARLFAGYGDMNLANFDEVVETVASRLKNKDKSDLEIQGEVIKALDEQGIKVTNPSAILKDSLAQVQKTVAQNKAYYQTMSGLGADTSGDVKAAEIDKLRVAASNQKAQTTAQSQLQELLKSVNDIAETAKNNREQASSAVNRLEKSFAESKNDLIDEMSSITGTTKDCIVPEPVNNKGGKDKFSDDLRLRFLRSQLVESKKKPDLSLIRGEAIIGSDDLAKFSCIVRKGQADNFLNSLKPINANASVAIDQLKTRFTSCLNRPNFQGFEQCLKTAINKFENMRKAMSVSAQNLVSSLGSLATFSKNSFPGLFLWSNQLGKPGIDTDGSVAFYLLKLNPVPILAFDNLVDAHENLNRHYYIKAILNIFGSEDQQAVTFAIPFGKKSLSQIKAASVDSEFTFLRVLLADYEDNNSLLIKARRNLDKEYRYFVANRMTSLINDEVQKLNNDILFPFLSQPAAELASYTDGVDPKKAKVWTAIETIKLAIDNLSDALKKDFIQSGDGDSKVASLNDFNLVSSGYRSLFEALFDLHNGLTSAGMTTSSFYTNLASFITVSGKSFDYNKQAELDKLDESAYDLANYNFTKIDGQLPSGTPPRTYENVDPADPTQPGKDSWHSKAAAGGVIKHPLEP